jgi:hypothetical protein
MLRNRRLPAAREPITMDGGLVSRPWFRFFDEFLNFGVGEFYDTTAQTVAADTPAAITFDSTSTEQYVSIGTPTSRIVIAAAGLYNIAFSLQFTNPQSSEDNVVVWLRVNGTNVADSASWITVPSKHGSLNGKALMALNLYYEFTAGDYFELMWLTEDGDASLSFVASSASYPRSPSAVLTVNQLL